jgi:hypothetical protein
MRFFGVFLGAVLVIGQGPLSAHAEKRVALVVGNSAYQHVARLDNPGNDATLLADTLRGLGFALVGGGAQLDLNKAALDQVVQAFGKELSDADVGLFYYAGHGLQAGGANYLVPVDANPTREADVDFQMLDTKLLLRQMEASGTRLNIVVLDACRNSPFAGRYLAVGRAKEQENTRVRAISAGLAEMPVPDGTLISFSTQPGSIAQDGAGGNSPFAKALADTITKPGLNIFEAFNRVGLEVNRATGGAQRPWVSISQIAGDFYFVPFTMLLREVPRPNTLGAGQVVLVDDDTCPQGQIKQVTAGNSFEKLPRQTKCIIRPGAIAKMTPSVQAPRSIERFAVGGRPAEFDHYFALKADCTPVWQDVRISKAPEKGEARIKTWTGLPSYQSDDRRAQCNRTSTNGFALEYSAPKGFTGNDSIEIEQISESGSLSKYRYNITVK